MSQASTYQPGVCNIGPAEVRRRKRSGWAGVAVSVVFLGLAFTLDWPAPWRLFVALPAAVAASGFLQAAFHFCARFGAMGRYNFGDLGKEESVLQTEFRKQDQRKAVRIGLTALGIGILVALIALLIPAS